jgi:iron complex outermembrane recepter protein
MYKLTFQFIVLLFTVASFAQESAETPQNYNETSETVSDTVKKKGGALQEVIIIKEQNGSGSVVRGEIKPMDLPQSIQVINNEVIAQQQALRMSDVVKNVNGVYVGSARGGAQESFFSRGYDMSANNMFKNGFRFSGGSIPEVSSLEKVEVLKGSAALLFGNVAPGGILNMVTKAPLFRQGGEFSTQGGSYAFYKPSLDFYGPINKSIAYRINGSYENSESFRDIVENKRYYVNPSVLFKANAKTEILVQGDYLEYEWTPDFGTGIIGKEILDLPRNLYLGAKWSHGRTKQITASGLVKHELNSNWQLNFNSSFQDYTRTSKGTERIQPAANGDWNRPLGQNKNLERIFGEQFYVSGNFNTGKIKHQLTTGVDYEFATTDAYTYVFNPTTYGSGNVFDFENFDQGTGIPDATNTRIVETDTNRFGIYAQDLVSLSEQFKVLAGLRWSWQEAQAETKDVVANTTTEAPKRNDRAFSPKIGVVYQPTTKTSLFASYATSFTPNTGSTVNGDPIEASIIDQFELGVKKDFWQGLLSTNVTLYQIVNSNLAQTAEFKADGTPNTDTNVKVLSGQTTSKGIELDVTAKPIDGLKIMAGYSYNDMRYTKTAETNGSFIEGDRLVRTPANTANLSFFYTIPTGKLAGISFGAMGNYIGNRFGGWNNQIVIDPASGASSINDRQIPIDGYTTIDFSAGYEWKKFSLLCKLSNVGNVLNYTVHENYSVNPIAPRQFLASLRYRI